MYLKLRVATIGALVAFAVASVPASGSAFDWSTVTTPNPSGSGALIGIACTSASSCMAVGQSTAGALAEVENGSTWQIVSTPIPQAAGGATLQGVACPSSSVCFAVGFALDKSAFDDSATSIGTLIERWDGTSWTIQSNPTASTAGALLFGVSCSSASLCTAVGATDSGGLLAERWNGTSWSVQSVPTP